MDAIDGCEVEHQLDNEADCDGEVFLSAYALALAVHAITDVQGGCDQEVQSLKL